MPATRSRARTPAPTWGVSPPPPKIRKYDRIRIVNSTPVKLVIVSNHLEELNTHFHERRTVPCTEGAGACWLDHQLVGKPRYGAWLAVCYPNSLKTCLLRLTACALAVEARLRDKCLILRGLELEVWRQGNHEKEEMQCRLYVDRPRAEKLPNPIDVRYAVERMLDADDRAAPYKSKREPGFMASAHAAAAVPV